MEDECQAEMGALLSLPRGEECAAGDGRLERIRKAQDGLGHVVQRADEMTRGCDGIDGSQATGEMRQASSAS